MTKYDDLDVDGSGEVRRKREKEEIGSKQTERRKIPFVVGVDIDVTSGPYRSSMFSINNIAASLRTNSNTIRRAQIRPSPLILSQTCPPNHQSNPSPNLNQRTPLHPPKPTAFFHQSSQSHTSPHQQRKPSHTSTALSSLSSSSRASPHWFEIQSQPSLGF